jgi:hypothetical protein
MPRSRTLPRWSIAALALALTLGLTGCGPSDEEVARGVLFVTPVPFVVGVGLLLGLVKLWRRLRPELAFELRPPLFALGFLVCVSGLSLFAVPVERTTPAPPAEKIVDLAGIVLALYGCSFLTIHLAVWRVWFALRPRTAFAWSWTVPVAVGLLPGAPLVLGLTTTLWNPAVAVWIYAGCAGIVTGIVAVLLFAEVLVRRRLALRAEHDRARGADGPRLGPEERGRDPQPLEARLERARAELPLGDRREDVEAGAPETAA